MKWVMPGDFESPPESNVGEFICTCLLSQNRMQQSLGAVLERTGDGPWKDLFDAIFYHTRFEMRSGIILIEIKNPNT